MGTATTGTGKTLVFDPFAGVSGDMVLGGLVDLGLEEGWLRGFVDTLDLGEIGIDVGTVVRKGITARHVQFRVPPQKAHRHLHHVLEIVNASTAPERARRRAADAFHRIAEAEAAIHGTSVEKVHFHEVGALDSILDVLCAMAGVEALGFETFCTRPVAVGSGWIQIEHGRYPVPAPAALRLLEGVPLTGDDLDGECTTPTGAAILMTLTEGKGPPPTWVAEGSGYGAGTRDTPDRPNCLRLIAARSEEPLAPPAPDVGGAQESLCVLQADLDDMPPEYVPSARDALFSAGALDVTFMALFMKKDRPGLRLEALVPEQRLGAVLEAAFASTTTIGVRYWKVLRAVLPRSEDTVMWRGHAIRRKRVVMPDGQERWKPEHDDVVRAAASEGWPPSRLRLELDFADAQTKAGSV